MRAGLALVVRRLDNTVNVVWVGFFQSRRCDADEFAFCFQLVNCGGTCVKHGLSKAAEELVDHRTERSPVGHLPLNSLGNELFIARDVSLEVAISGVRGFLTATLERAERPHAPVVLELLTVDENKIPWAFVGPRKQRAEHDRIGPGDKSFGDISRILKTTVSNHGNTGRNRSPGGFPHRRDLWNTHTRHNPRRAD